MLYRRLPGTDLDVSALALGTWSMGGLWWGDPVDDRTATAAVRAALDGGITLFDTAPLYGHGHADEVLAAALGSDRDRVVLATKVGVRFGGDTSDGTDHARSDLDPTFVRADLEASLRRLRTDRIDLLQIHWPCESDTPLQDTLGALTDLQQQGKVRHIGLCNYDAEGLARAAGLAPIATLQTPLSMVRREGEQHLLPACAEAGIGVIAYEPLCRGLLTDRFGATPPSFPDTDLRSRDERFGGMRYERAARFVADLRRAADRLGVPVAAVALAWAARREGVASALFGARRPSHVIEDLVAARLLERLDERRWRALDAIADTWAG